MAAAIGAEVTVFRPPARTPEAMRALGANVSALYPFAEAIDRAVREADLLIGAVLIPGARAAHVVSHAKSAA